MKFSLIVLTLISFNIHALETDQFIATDIVIKDSKDVITDYFKDKMNKAIEKANKKNPEKVDCREIANDTMTGLVGRFSISKISQFAKKSPLVDKYPDNSVSDREYFKMTFYQHAGILLHAAPLARTINLNGIYMGTDKLGHFSLVGRNYYHSYLKNLKDGMTKDEALRKAILKGHKTETGILGYGIGGVLSYGDLEANYEGLKFAIDMCEGERPYYKLNNGRWELNPEIEFDLMRYFNPRMDESYNFSFWRPYLFKRISPKMLAEYCTVKDNPNYKARVEKYPSMIVENLNDQLIKENLLSRKKFDRKLEDVANLCEEK